jgi:hypothetical protein
MNGWITEQLLQDEIRTNERIREEFEQAARLRRQQDGEITGYSIKTKRHFKNYATVTKKDEVSNVAVNESGEEPTSVQGVVATSTDVTKCSEEGTMCTICLLELEDGDRIADLGCGHFYHAECLGEWVLKKVNIFTSCVLQFFIRLTCHVRLMIIASLLGLCIEFMPIVSRSRSSH